MNCDDSTIKINGTGYNDLCVCNDKYTRLWVSEKKDRDSWKDMTILSDYKGIIVKDGTDEIQKLTDKYIGIVDSQVADKEKEVMTV